MQSAALLCFILLCTGCTKITRSTQDISQRPPSILHLASASTLTIPSGKARIKRLAEGGNAFIGHLWLAPNATVPEHRDESEEYLFILDGHGQIFIDGVSYEIKRGHLIYMQSGARVRYINGNQPLKALQIFAGPESASKYNSWKEMQQPPQSEPLE